MEDGADGAFFGGGEVGVFGGGFGFAEGGGEVAVDALFHLGREAGEDGAVDHVAATVAEEAGVEVEVFEGGAVFGGAAVAGEVGAKGGVALDAASGEGDFVGG